MMYQLEYSTQFKKDFKKITKLPIPDVLKLGHVISTLQNGDTLAAK
jgi:mRNA interferase YafQ